MRQLLPRSAPALAVIAAVALFAGSGGAVAGSMITGKQIKDNTVSSKDIKDHSLTVKDLAPGVVAQLGGVTGFTNVREQVNVTAGQSANLIADCPAGTNLVSVAGHWAYSSKPVQALTSLSDARRGAVYSEPIGDDDILRIQVVCATHSP